MTVVHKHLFYCKTCKRLRPSYKKWVEENVFPVENPKFNIVSFDCNICGTLLVQTNQLNYVVE